MVKKKTTNQIKRLYKHRVFQSWSVSKQVLAVMAEMAGEIAFGPISLYLRRGKMEGINSYWKGSSLRNSLNYLERKGYIEKFRQSGESLYKLSDLGVKYAERLTIRMKYSEMKWDGRWRFVIFDVPEEEKFLRDNLRNTLKLLGFKKVQLSVWVFPYDVFDDLEKLIPDIKKHQWIKLIDSDDVVNDKDIYKKFFGKQEN